MSVLRAVLGVLLGCVARLWLWTLRLHIEVSPELAEDPRPRVLSFFHGTQFSLLAWHLRRSRRPTLVMVSHSADGQLQARALGLLGMRVVRGSSSRGGARALAAMVHGLRRARGTQHDAAFAVDGPRGPYGEVKEGALVAAARSGGVLVPLGAAVANGKVLARAWDRFVLAWPFSRVVVVLGPPVESNNGDALAAAIRDANARATEVLARLRATGVSAEFLEQ